LLADYYWGGGTTEVELLSRKEQQCSGVSTNFDNPFIYHFQVNFRGEGKTLFTPLNLQEDQENRTVGLLELRRSYGSPAEFRKVLGVFSREKLK
jgi:hypothetical protein